MMRNNEQERLAAFIMACATLPKGILFADALTCTLYASDASMYQIQPLAVLVPQTSEQVQLAVRAAIQTGIPIIGRGSGTSLAGQAIGRGLVIDFTKHLNRILHFNAEKRQITVEPGLILDDLNRFLAPHGLLFGPDPASASRATLGGMTATNATGTHSIAYGSMVDHIVAATLILHDGSLASLQTCSSEQLQVKQKQEDATGKLYQKIHQILQEKEAIIRRDTPRHWRRQGGYRIERLLEEPFNLAKLLCGSEGTLGILTNITLSLVEKPHFTAMAIAHFDDRMAALRATPALLTTDPYAIELLDHHALDRCREVPDYAPRLTFVEGNPVALLMTEVIGETLEICIKRLTEAVNICQRQTGCIAVTVAQSAAELSNVREVRKAGLGLVMGTRGDLKPLPFIEDAAVPVEYLADYVTELEAALAETQTQATIYGHASAGCLHIRPYVNPQTELGLARMKHLAMASAELAKKYGGVISSEHGDGLVRGWLAESFFGPDLYGVYREIKQAFDPQNLFNPGKKTDSPPFTENLRAIPVKKNTYESLDFSEVRGLEAATELCNGAGVCRKLQAGTMCPPFRATHDEMHSTRGRANVLRAALAGSLALDGPEMKAAMALCISCKACKAECPSSVDMAKLKLAWQTVYFRAHKAPLRDRMMAALPRILPLLSGKMAPIANGVSQIAFFRKGLRALAKIDNSLPLPTFSKQPFGARNLPPLPDSPDLVLFVDTFNTYLTPDVTRDALWLLEQMDVRPLVVTRQCCGRTYISKGLIQPVLKSGKRLLDQLAPYAEKNIPLVGLEPSCILTLKDEYPAFFPTHPAIKSIARYTMTFDFFLAQPHILNKLKSLKWPTKMPAISIHSHCHQKAIEGTSAIKQVLNAIPNLTGNLPETGCCGMAGSFGYEAEHTEYSLKMAEDSLLPAIRNNLEAQWVACGSSCQHQIHRTMGKTARHTAQVITHLLRKS